MQGNTYNKENLQHNQPMQLNGGNPTLRHQVRESVNRTELPIPSTPIHTTASETPNWQGQASLRIGENYPAYQGSAETNSLELTVLVDNQLVT